MKKKMTLNLDNYRTKRCRVFSGRDRGEQVRKAAGLDEADATDSIIEIIIPDDILSVNSSFFLGLFAASVKRFGENKFREKYTFISSELHLADINDGINRAIMEATCFT